MRKPVNTYEDRQRRLDALIERLNKGMSIRDALADMGYTGKSAGQQYRQIRIFSQKNDPVAFAALPEKIGDSVAPVPSLADAFQGMTDAAETFFGECEDMGISLGKEPVTDHDEIDKESEVSAIRHKKFGEFYHDYDHNCIDWRTGGGDEMSMSIEGWKEMYRKLPSIFRKLGVEL